MGRYIKSAVAALVAINVAVCLILKLTALLSASTGETVAASLGLSLHPFQPWGLLSYMFTQTGLLHLLFNCIIIWCFGRLYMTLATGRQLWLTYVVGGLCGGVAFLLASALGWTGGTLYGSSAAALAVAVAAGVRTPNLEMNFLAVGGIRLKWIVITLALLSLAELPGGGGIAHVGGILGGFLGAALTKRTLRFRVVRPVKPSAEAPSTETDAQALDRLLEKVRRSGYPSLSSSERRQLMDLSNRM